MHSLQVIPQFLLCYKYFAVAMFCFKKSDSAKQLIHTHTRTSARGHISEVKEKKGTVFEHKKKLAGFIIISSSNFFIKHVGCRQVHKAISTSMFLCFVSVSDMNFLLSSGKFVGKQ
jgi:uncharacterized membrane protein YbaN (DUF454 family)